MGKSGFTERVKRLLRTPVPVPEPEDPYRSDWNSLAREDALTAILSRKDGQPMDKESFDANGRDDAERVRRHLPPDPIVLSIGCGIGRVERHLAASCTRLCAVDVSDEMLARAREWTAGRANLEFYRTSAIDLSMFPDRSFDFVYSLLVLQHLDYADAFLALREIARVLKMTGRALLQFPNLSSPVHARVFVLQAEAHDRGAARMRYYTLDLAAQVLSMAGLTIVDREGGPAGARDPNELDLIVGLQVDHAPTGSAP